MAQNARIYYPIQAIGFAPIGTPLSTPSGYRPAKGVQSLSVTTDFGIEQVSQLGQLEIYENIETVPDVSLTVEKVIDGYSLIQHLATPNAVASSLAGRYNDNQCMAVIALYPITQEAASGQPLKYCLISGLYVSDINFNFPLEGNFTESVTLVARDKVWYDVGADASGSPWASGAYRTRPFFADESPVLASGGVHRRQDMLMGSGYSRFPTPDIVTDVNGFNIETNGQLEAHIGDVTVSCSLGRTDIFEQGRRLEYYKYANFPLTVSTTINITATEEGDNVNADSSQDNGSDQTIKFVFQNGLTIDLGTKNRLTNVSYDGGGTDGGNVSISYTYENFNSLRVIAPVVDPAGLS